MVEFFFGLVCALRGVIKTAASTQVIKVPASWLSCQTGSFMFTAFGIEAR